MQIISVINYKGGVGKTTITANLAAEMAFRGKSVLAIDLDPQASLTFSFFTVDEWGKDYEASRTIKNWYDAFIDRDADLNLGQLIATPQRVNGQMKGKLDLICSHLALINVDLELATRLVGGTERDLRNNFLRVHSRLRQGLESLSADSYDYVLIDCPPNFNVVTKTAIAASDHLLVPTKPDYLSTLGIEQLKKHVEELVGTYNSHAGNAGNSDWHSIDPTILGVVFTMIQIYGGQPLATQQQYIEQVKRLGVTCLDTMIRKNDTSYGGAPEYGVPVVLKHVSGKTYQDVQRELESLTTEVLKKVSP